VGGNTHFIILVGGEDPEELLKSYHEYIGKAHIPPFWSMGYHQSRWGYRSLETVEKVVSLFQEYEIPLDTFWLDLDYMLNKKIFTVDEISYPPEDLNELMKAYNLRLVPLLDVGIATKDSQPVKLGKNMNIFLRSPSPLEYYYKGESGLEKFTTLISTPQCLRLLENTTGKTAEKNQLFGNLARHE
jgi:alpha-glucosidase (family GH31 glycosyl hydrolase)